MKNLKIVLFSVLTLGLALTTSCGDDDSSSNNNTSGALEGKWIHDKTGAIVQGHEALINYTHSEGCDKDYVEVLAGGTGKEVEYDSSCEVWSENTTWTREGNTLTVKYGEDYEVVYTIKTLTGTDLKVESTETFEGETSTWVDTFKRG